MLLYLTITKEKRDSVIEKFKEQNIKVCWETDDVITIDENDGSKISAILCENEVPFTSDKNELPFGNIFIKEKIDNIYLLSKKVMEGIGDCSEYTDEENEMLDEIANVINVYQNVFDIKTGTIKGT